MIKKGQKLDWVKKPRHQMLRPKQDLFLKYWLEPSSETFGNSTQSALKAGYPFQYAKAITATNKKLQWLENGISNRKKMLMKAESNLNDALNIPITNIDLGERALKATFFVAERLGKIIYGKEEEQGGNGVKILILPKTLILKNGINNGGNNIESSTGTDSIRPAQV